MLKYSLAAASLAAAVLFAAPGGAAPVTALSQLKGAEAAQSMVEKTHGWHRTCRRGLTDVHKHVRGVGRVECHSRKCWTNSYGVKRCTWY
jgi:hypothetical protein